MLSIEARGHMCVMLPKFHCECNGIELAWARSKQYTRANCEYTMPGLRKTVPMSYGRGNMSLEFHRKISRKARDYIRGYGAGGSASAVDAHDCQKLVNIKKTRRQHRSMQHETMEPKHQPWGKKKEANRKRAEAAAAALASEEPSMPTVLAPSPSLSPLSSPPVHSGSHANRAARFALWAYSP